MLSYWEQQSFLHYDVLIAGGGITGLSAAISLKEKKPYWKIALLERGIFPAGASTRNAGFACIGSFTEILDDLQHLPEEKVLALIRMRREGLQLLRKRLGDKAINYRENGSYELISENDLAPLDRLEDINTWLYPVLNGPAFSLNNKKIKEFGFNAHKVKALIQNHYEGELHTGKMMQELIHRVLLEGIEIKTGCNVEKIEEGSDAVALSISNTVQKNPVIFRADKVAVCTNAFTKKLLPDVDLKPGRGQVLITEPIAGLKLKGIFHFDKGYYYFREIDGRVLFGGGRNMDFANETTTEAALNDRIQQDLEKKLHQLILPRRSIRISNRWSGIMAFGKNKFPMIKRYSGRVYLGVKMGGMGIAAGSEVGERLAELIVSADAL